MKLLILEDNPSLNEHLRSQFKTLLPSAEILSAYNINDTARLKPLSDFDLISLDLDLPDGSGLAFAQSLFKELGPKMPPVLFITGNNNYEVAFQCYDTVKCVKYLSKPVQLEALKAVLDSLFPCKHGAAPLFTYKNKQLYLRLNYDEILYFEKSISHTSVVTRHDRYDLGRVALKEIMTELDPNGQLLQIHKSILINTAHVEQVLFENPQWLVVLKHLNTRLPVGRVYKAALQHFLDAQPLQENAL